MIRHRIDTNQCPIGDAGADGKNSGEPNACSFSCPFVFFVVLPEGAY